MALIIFNDKIDNILLYLVNKNVFLCSVVPYFELPILSGSVRLYSVGS